MSANPMAHTPPQSSPDSDSFNAPLCEEDIFDASTFPFLQTSLMEPWLASPDMGPEEFNIPPMPQDTLDMGAQDIGLGLENRSSEGNFSGFGNLMIGSPTGAHHDTGSLHHYGVQPYSAATSNPHFFHPYRQSLRGPRSPHQRPISPLNTPPGSGASGHILPLHQSPGISPAMISPGSILSNMSDSPTGQWGAAMAYPGNGTPLHSIDQLATTPPTGMPTLGMVSGFPYPTQQVAVAAPSPAPSRTTRQSRAAVRSQQAIKRENDADDDDDDLSDDEGRRPGPSRLGLDPNTDGAERINVPHRREDIRKARIESEQRRRDELREGFKRLKDSLPATNQRSSKANLLDRAVAHIQSMGHANTYLMNQQEILMRDLETLRATNSELVHAVAANARAGSSPRSTGGKS